MLDVTNIMSGSFAGFLTKSLSFQIVKTQRKTSNLNITYSLSKSHKSHGQAIFVAHTKHTIFKLVFPDASSHSWTWLVHGKPEYLQLHQKVPPSKLVRLFTLTPLTGCKRVKDVVELFWLGEREIG